MKLFQFFKIVVTLTILAVVYIHMQMQIYEIAYLAKDKEKSIRQVIEDNGNLTYMILTLKSSNHLGDTLLVEDNDMEFADGDRVVKIETENEEIASGNVALQTAKSIRSIFQMFPER